MELQVCLTFSDMDKLRKFKKLHFCAEGKCLPFIESRSKCTSAKFNFLMKNILFLYLFNEK